MKPLEEYMLYTQSDAEKVNVVNAQGVRSAQCSADFDEAWPERDQLGAAHNGSFLIVSGKQTIRSPKHWLGIHNRLFFWGPTELFFFELCCL